MTQSTRKLIGTLGLIVLLVAYPLGGMAVFVALFEDATWWIALPYALVVGLFWAVPAGLIIRWMSRP